MDPEKKKKIFKKKSETSGDSPSKKPVETHDLEPEFVRARDLHGKLQEQIDDMYAQAGLTSKDVQHYLDNPSNFTEAEYIEVKRLREHYEEKLNQQLGAKAVKKKKVKEAEKSSKKLRGRSIGHKRNWIQMD